MTHLSQIISEFQYNPALFLLFLYFLQRSEDNDGNNPTNKSDQQKNESKKNPQSVRRPLEDRSNMNNKRSLRSCERRILPDGEENTHSLSSVTSKPDDPKPKRRRR